MLRRVVWCTLPPRKLEILQRGTGCSVVRSAKTVSMVWEGPTLCRIHLLDPAAAFVLGPDEVIHAIRLHARPTHEKFVLGVGHENVLEFGFNRVDARLELEPPLVALQEWDRFANSVAHHHKGAADTR